MTVMYILLWDYVLQLFFGTTLHMHTLLDVYHVIQRTCVLCVAIEAN